MSKNLSLFIFRNDLRLQDNTALIQALKNSQKVLLVYLLENLDIFKIKNYNNQQFIIESLYDLDKLLQKYNSQILFIKNINNLNLIIKNYKINNIYINKLYHPKHILQETKIKNLCVKNKVNFNIYHDFLLHDPEKSKKVYKVYTPFLRAFANKDIKVLQANNYKNYFNKKDIKNNINILKLIKKNNKNIHVHGGYTSAIKIINNLEKFKNYKDTRDYPGLKDSTTKLSAYINTGAISVRQVYSKIIKLFGKNHELIRQLYWREFYYQLYFLLPELFNTVLRKRNIKWQNNNKFFNLWKSGNTKILLLDAGIKELNTTGFMHNRVRMLVANYLSLKMWINWQKGEKYFAQKLTDYDPILNNGNWQYMAQVGANTAPFPRILNPEIQRKKFDKNGEYIKKWSD
ncbi:MAG: Deoxyribodipyrimidine photolyase [candidate division TM6 bacterium GW2011_GWF2_28_16]|nr:MAG: Deoxyribodipyrimidine photolyase [candidate division TM6 bacterium GW2011_GWF2_28_16]